VEVGRLHLNVPALQAVALHLQDPKDLHAHERDPDELRFLDDSVDELDGFQAIGAGEVEHQLARDELSKREAARLLLVQVAEDFEREGAEILVVLLVLEDNLKEEHMQPCLKYQVGVALVEELLAELEGLEGSKGVGRARYLVNQAGVVARVPQEPDDLLHRALLHDEGVGSLGGARAEQENLHDVLLEDVLESLKLFELDVFLHY